MIILGDSGWVLACNSNHKFDIVIILPFYVVFVTVLITLKVSKLFLNV